MKKSLVIISFAFIFLLSMSFVSAGWFSDFWAKVTGKTSGPCIGSGCEKADVPSKDNEAIAKTGGSGGIPKTKAGVSSTLTRKPLPGMERRTTARGAGTSRVSTTSTTTQTGCTNGCSPNGAKQCSGSTSYKTCGNYDVDSCLEWSSVTSCPISKTCVSGNCTNQTSCTNECSTNGANQCIGTSGYQTCGNYDADPCLDLSSSTTSCSPSETCAGGACVSSAWTCTDSDGGQNYNVQGTIVYSSPSSSGSTSDFCTSSSVLIERFCTGSGSQSQESHTCPNGCSNGACLP